MKLPSQIVILCMNSTASVMEKHFMFLGISDILEFITMYVDRIGRMTVKKGRN